MTRPIVVFDLDGTLAETAPDIMSTLNTILDEEGLATMPVERARELVGAGARALIDRAFRLHGIELPSHRLEILFQRFLDIYAGRIADESHLFPGVEAALMELSEAGYLLAICTNKPEHHSRLLLDALGIGDRFAVIAGRDTFPVFKPDPRHLTLTIAAAGADPAKAVMVGDSKTDISTAQAAGVPVIAVPFGYTDKPVAELGPDVVIDRFDQLFAQVERLCGVTQLAKAAAG